MNKSTFKSRNDGKCLRPIAFHSLELLINTFMSSESGCKNSNASERIRESPRVPAFAIWIEVHLNLLKPFIVFYRAESCVLTPI